MSRAGFCDTTGRTCSAPDAAGVATCGVGSSGGGGGGTAAIGYIRLAQAEHQVLGAYGSGYFEQSLLVFEVVASDGTPYAGLPVKFSHQSQEGSFIGSVAACTTGTSPVCTAQGTTDGEGRVAVVLHSGRRYATLSVKAEATAAGVTRELVAGGFTVVGAKPTGARFSVDCRPYNVPALTVHDCLYSRYAGQARNVECTATLGDRHGNALAVPTLVAFQSEAGEIVPATFTPEFDPTKDGEGLGQALGILNVYGAPLPFDVEPFAWETSLQWDYGCGLRKANPRDGLVTVIALVAGEEGFVDQDLDGTYDAGRAVHRPRRAVRGHRRRRHPRSGRVVRGRERGRLLHRPERQVGRGHRAVDAGASPLHRAPRVRSRGRDRQGAPDAPVRVRQPAGADPAARAVHGVRRAAPDERAVRRVLHRRAPQPAELVHDLRGRAGHRERVGQR